MQDFTDKNSAGFIILQTSRIFLVEFCIFDLKLCTNVN